MAHLTAASKVTPKPTSIKQAEKIEQDVKKATGADKVEREVTSHTNNLELPQVESPQVKPSPDVKSVAEAALSPSLMRKLLDGVKLTTDEQKQVALVCKQVGFL